MGGPCHQGRLDGYPFRRQCFCRGCVALADPPHVCRSESHLGHQLDDRDQRSGGEAGGENLQRPYYQLGAWLCDRPRRPRGRRVRRMETAVGPRHKRPALLLCRAPASDVPPGADHRRHRYRRGPRKALQAHRGRVGRPACWRSAAGLCRRPPDHLAHVHPLATAGSAFKAVSCFDARLLFLRQWKGYVLPRFNTKQAHSTQTMRRNTKMKAQTKKNALPKTTAASGYEFVGGYPTSQTVQKAYDEADMNRAIQAYRFFFPNVSILGLFKGFEPVGTKNNNAFVILEGRPSGVLFTPNSDTPYAAMPLDLTVGPITVKLPEGPLIGVANDLNFRWVIDMGLPGPDAGKGGKHVIMPPEYKGKVH